MPSSSILVLASADGLDIRSSIVLKLVPASEPIRPADANAARVPVVSSIDSPNCDATRPDCLSAIAMSETSPWALPAPAAIKSAM